MRLLLWLAAILSICAEFYCLPHPGLGRDSLKNAFILAEDTSRGHLDSAPITASNAKWSLTSWWTTITPEIAARQNNNDCVSNCGTGNSNGGSNNNVGNGSSGTSTTDRNIALGIGLGVGLPGAIVATYQILKYLSKKKEEENQDLKQQNARNGGLTAGQHQQQYAQQIGSFGGPRAQGAAELGN